MARAVAGCGRSTDFRDVAEHIAVIRYQIAMSSTRALKMMHSSQSSSISMTNYYYIDRSNHPFRSQLVAEIEFEQAFGVAPAHALAKKNVGRLEPGPRRSDGLGYGPKLFFNSF